MQFKDLTLAPGATKDFVIVIGIAGNEQEARSAFQKFNSSAKFNEAFEKNKGFWFEKSHSLHFQTEIAFNAWIQWVTIQPVLRRIFGCSFLPDDDYGKGGKGWRHRQGSALLDFDRA